MKKKTLDRLDPTKSEHFYTREEVTQPKKKTSVHPLEAGLADLNAGRVLTKDRRRQDDVVATPTTPAERDGGMGEEGRPHRGVPSAFSGSSFPFTY